MSRTEIYWVKMLNSQKKKKKFYNCQFFFNVRQTYFEQENVFNKICFISVWYCIKLTFENMFDSKIN